MLLLLVEDDLDLAAAIIDFLELDNVRCDHAADGELALRLIREQAYDVVILDINLPKRNGLDVCEAMRQAGLDTPVLMLTAMDTLQDKLTGFDKGADDYLIKPFDMEELVVRAKVLAKRRSGQMTKLAVGDLIYHIERTEITRGGTPVTLSPTAVKILEVLMRASPNVVSREKLISDVWGDEAPDSNSLKVHMFNLRKQVDQGFETKLLHTVTGKGFAVREESKA
jgi:DNA-binding response OmpR family regulator